jgi:hypothetical protein
VFHAFESLTCIRVLTIVLLGRYYPNPNPGRHIACSISGDLTAVGGVLILFLAKLFRLFIYLLLLLACVNFRVRSHVYSNYVR